MQMTEMRGRFGALVVFVWIKAFVKPLRKTSFGYKEELVLEYEKIKIKNNFCYKSLFIYSLLLLKCTLQGAFYIPLPPLLV